MDDLKWILDASSNVILGIIILRLLASAEVIALRVIDRLANCDCTGLDGTTRTSQQ